MAQLVRVLTALAEQHPVLVPSIHVMMDKCPSLQRQGVLCLPLASAGIRHTHHQTYICAGKKLTHVNRGKEIFKRKKQQSPKNVGSIKRSPGNLGQFLLFLDTWDWVQDWAQFGTEYIQLLTPRFSLSITEHPELMPLIWEIKGVLPDTKPRWRVSKGWGVARRSGIV